MSPDPSRFRLSSRRQESAPQDPARSVTAAAGDGHSSSATSLSRSALLDLAYDEYCVREEAGEAININQFCDRFPAIRSSLQRQLDVHRLLQENPELLQEVSDAQWPSVPGPFLGFSLGQELGAGAFARVYLATEPAVGNRKVVLKVSLEGHAEAHLLGRLEHPNVVPILSVHNDPQSGLSAICMPFLSGATLCDVIDHAHRHGTPPRGACTILEAVDARSRELMLERSMEVPSRLRHGDFEEGVLHLGVQLAEGLAYVHGCGICHRDLKPSNILVTPDGRPMLLDFNLSSDSRESDSRLGGTIPYMSPEQLRATGGSDPAEAIDFRSDLFSLGVVLFQTLTGRHPFGPLPSSGDVRRLLLERQRTGGTRLGSVLPNVDRCLARTIEQCLSFEPERRPRSAEALAVDFRRLLRPDRRLRRRLVRRWKIVAGAVIGGMLATTVAWSLAPPPEPASIKHQRLGRIALQQHQFSSAAEHYSQAVMLEPESGEAYFGRGRALMEMGQFPLAIPDFEKAFKYSGDPRAKACIAYCFGRSGLHPNAIDYGEASVALGCANAAVFNNLGYSRLQRNDLDAAEKILNRAIELDDRLQAAYHNRARVDRQRFFSKPNHVPRRGLEDIRRALTIPPVAADLYFDAAYLSACAATLEGGHVEPALDFVAKALELGQDPLSFKNDRGFAVFASEPRFQSLLESAPKVRKGQRSARLVNPIDD